VRAVKRPGSGGRITRRLFREIKEADGGGGQQKQSAGDDEAPNAGILRLCFGITDEGGAHVAIAVFHGAKGD
jgi:hypothetical protein